MSTIKSSDEHLTLNADGSSKDIKFQANGVEKASIDSSGNLTVSGNFTSLGIDDNADATAMTIDSNERVTVNSGELVVSNNASWGGEVAGKIEQLNNTLYIQGGSGSTSHIFRNSSGTNILDLTNDGRGLSQFTAKTWVRYGGTSSTIAVADSHNVSSVTHISVGTYQINYANNLANATYVAVGNDDWYGLNYFNLYNTGNVRHTHLNNNWTQRDTGICTALVFGD